MLQKIKDNWQPLLIGIAIGGTLVYFYHSYSSNK